MVIEIREVGQQDKAQWLQLWEGYTCFYGSPQQAGRYRIYLAAHAWLASPVLGRVALADGTSSERGAYPPQATTVKTPVCYLEDLFVDPQVRRQGIARRLMQALQTEGKRKGWSRIYWNTRTGNPAAVFMINLRPSMTMCVTA